MKRSFYRLWWLVLLSPFVAAKDLGVMGQTFEVVEVDMMVWIEQRLAQKKSGWVD